MSKSNRPNINKRKVKIVCKINDGQLMQLRDRELILNEKS